MSCFPKPPAFYSVHMKPPSLTNHSIIEDNNFQMKDINELHHLITPNIHAGGQKDTISGSEVGHWKGH